MAAESPPLETKREVQYRELAARSYVARVNSPRVPFQWTINPYRGCEFGCKYCYARYTHEFMEMRDGRQFETEIFAKQFQPEVLQRELERLPRGEAIAIGTATDPYQPAERRYLVTRRMLQVFAATSGHRVGITTKSDLIARDVDLLLEVRRRHFLTVMMTITTLDADLARRMEPKAPRPDLRLRAVAKLAGAGIDVRVSCAPILPLLNDGGASLRAVVAGAASAGARDVWGNVVFLKESAQAMFFPFLAEDHPALLHKYQERFRQDAYLRGAYPEAIEKKLASLRAEFGFPRGAPQALPELWPSDPQLPLFV
jgi:DNA repair photolyase